MTNISSYGNITYYDSDNANFGFFGGCYAPNSDVVRYILDVESEVTILGSSPNTCSSGSQSANTSDCDSCVLLENCRNQITDDRIDQALLVLNRDLQNTSQGIDNVTGSYLARQFNVSILTVGSPKIRQDQSMDIKLLVHFVPLETCSTPSKEHLRVYCSSIKKFVFGLVEQLDDVNMTNTTADCSWDQQSSADGYTRGCTLNFPSNVWQQFCGNVTGEPLTPLPPIPPNPVPQPLAPGGVPPGQNPGDNGNGPIGDSAGSITAGVSLIAALLFFLF